MRGGSWRRGARGGCRRGIRGRSMAASFAARRGVTWRGRDPSPSCVCLVWEALLCCSRQAHQLILLLAAGAAWEGRLRGRDRVLGNFGKATAESVGARDDRPTCQMRLLSLQKRPPPNIKDVRLRRSQHEPALDPAMQQTAGSRISRELHSALKPSVSPVECNNPRT